MDTVSVTEINTSDYRKLYSPKNW